MNFPIYRIGGVMLIISTIGEAAARGGAALITPLGSMGAVFGICFAIDELRCLTARKHRAHGGEI
ncbi:MAG: hypothetical protein WDN44_12550 [Sphingomonas sp.]